MNRDTPRPDLDGDEPLLVVEELTKTFHLHQRHCHLPAISALSFSADRGSITALVGPSGAGKSSVLNCIHRTYLATEGRILLRSAGTWVDLVTADEHGVLALRRRQIGFVTQFLRCLPRQAAIEVVAEAALRQGLSRAQATERAGHLLHQLGIPEALWHLPPATFSGGEKQRVNIARGFARDSDLLLLDEPTASLDAHSAAQVGALIRKAREAGTCIIGIWHDPAIVASLADQVVRIDRPTPLTDEVLPCRSA